MKLLVIDNDYPSDENLYGDVFAHVRIKEYLKQNYEIIVLAQYENTNNNKRETYIYQGVTVQKVIGFEDINSIIVEFNPNLIIIHFASKQLISNVILQNSNKKFVIWVHGYEALSFFRYHWSFNLFNPRALYSYFKMGIRDLNKLLEFRKLIQESNKTRNIHFVFISKWMKEVTSLDTLSLIKEYSIIPNPINSHFFSPKQKSIEDLRKILIIRPFTSKKYAYDLLTESIIELDRIGILNEFEFTVFGGGLNDSELFNKYQGSSNFNFNSHFINHSEIKKQHDQNGVFFCLSRMDAQGVSMCEAMSSGLLIISSANTAIPEFINSTTGVLTNNSITNIVNVFQDILNSPDKFVQIAKNGAISIERISGIDNILKDEIALISRFSKEMN